MIKYRNVVCPSDYGPLIINRNDDTIGACVSRFGYWGTADIQLLESILRTTCRDAAAVTLLDVGSNIGTHALAFARFPFPNVTVHAFEAQREVFYMLAGNVALGSLSNVHCHHRAVSDVGGVKLRIPAVDYDSFSNFGSYEVVKPVRSDTADMYIPGRFEEVETLRVDDLALENVKLLKVDVEGMEDKVVLGAAATIRANRPVLFVEAFKTEFAPIEALLRELDYACFMTPARDAVAIPREVGMGITGAQMLF